MMASAAVHAPPGNPRWSNAPLKKDSEPEKGIWSSMLDSVATDKKLAEKTLLVLGGTPDTQKQLLEAIPQNTPNTRRPYDTSFKKRPPIANRFALGHTYQDILDTDQDDILARLSLYFLSDCDDVFAPLLAPLFNVASIPNALVVILLDWDSPWDWARQLRDWIKILQRALSKLDNDRKVAMDENMKEWAQRRKGPPTEGFASASEGEVAVPLGSGAWDEALGLPICVVCQNAEKTEMLECEHAWKDDEFDFVQQYLRTVLLKHGGSLIYTASAAPGFLPDLVRSSLGVRSVTQRNALKHNVIDRDKILIPPNWDSWGKIRPLGEDFDIEHVSNLWSLDLQGRVAETPARVQEAASPTFDDGQQSNRAGHEDPNSAVSMYEARIEDPNRHRSIALQLGRGQDGGIETPCQDMQAFLAEQMQIVERLKVEDEKEQKGKESRRPGGLAAMASRDGRSSSSDRVNDHIGPVQFNMGGIQVDADDVPKTLKDREGAKSSEESSSVASPDGKLEHEKLSSFFAGLVSRGSNSVTSSPK